MSRIIFMILKLLKYSTSLNIGSCLKIETVKCFSFLVFQVIVMLCEHFISYKVNNLTIMYIFNISVRVTC